MNFIGIDVGSTTVKLVVIDEQGELLHSVYVRHNSRIKNALSEVIADYVKRYGNVKGHVAVTGSGGISVARMLGLPFVQEVIATTLAVQTLIPEADAIVELGGEDAKVVYLDGTIEQRMNATCAGGTGSFIDSIASMLGVYTREINMLAQRSRHSYPLASRCAVFAQSDVRALLNLGIAKEDIAASTLEAVVKQTIGGLACGRPIKGSVVFLGGPFQYVPELYRRFCKALQLTKETGIRPDKAHLYTARGAALEAQQLLAEQGADGVEGAGSDNLYSLDELKCMVNAGSLEEEGMAQLEPLFATDDERRMFDVRHAQERIERVNMTDVRGPLYIGIDAGASAVKVAAIDGEQRVCATLTRAANGDALTTAARLLEQLYAMFPGKSLVYISQAVATGSGDETIESALCVDESVVETRAHVRAARWFDPDASFVFDAGGQDMKAMWIDDGEISDVVLNDPCSSGCGIFLEESAEMLKWPMNRFSEEAATAPSPVELDTKCVVFMNSCVRHAQKVGTSHNDIAAGLAYSVAKNAYQRVISRSSQSELGSNIVVQGGLFKSDAVLRAFEKVSGHKVKRPSLAEYMGAIGAALIAFDRAQERAAAGEAAAGVASKVVAPDVLATFDPIYSTYICSGCESACVLSIVNYGGDRIYVSGNHCQNGAKVVHDESIKLSTNDILGSSSMIPRAKSNLRARNNSEIGNGIVIPGYLRSFSGGMVGGGGSQGISEEPRRVDYYANQLANDRTRERKIKIVPSKKYMSAEEVARKKQEDAKSEQQREEEARRLAAEQQKRLENLTVTSSTRTLKPQVLDIPNLAVTERELLAEFADAKGAGGRAAISIGLLNTLDNYNKLPFWHAFFRALGYGVMVPDAARAQEFSIKGAESVPSESVCDPAKITHARAYELVDRGAGALFIPHAQRRGRCAVLCDYASALADNMPAIFNGEVSLLSPRISGLDASAMPASKDDIPELSAALQALSGVSTPTEGEISTALDVARQAQEAFYRKLEDEARTAMEWVAAKKGRRGIVLGGRSYHMDEALLHDIDSRLSCMGYAVLTPGAVAGLLDFTAGSGADDSRSLPKHLRATVEFVKQEQNIDALFLHSFNCGYDSVMIEDARDELVKAGKPFAVIRLDEMTDAAHIDVYLRTLAESAASRTDAALAAGSVGEPGQKAAASPQDEVQQLSVELVGAIEHEDVDKARMLMPPDMCFTVAAVAARVYSELEAHPDASVVHLPPVCCECLTDYLPNIVGRALGRAFSIEWDGEWETPSGHDGSGSGNKAHIGIVGNPLLCFDTFMNEGLLDLLEALGVEPVLPKPELLQVEDTRFVAQLDEFAANGVAGVLYLQNFSCLKGHIFARGSLHELQRCYPDMPITVLDYDPESSALNRENRVRLAVSAAKRK